MPWDILETPGSPGAVFRLLQAGFDSLEPHATAEWCTRASCMGSMAVLAVVEACRGLNALGRDALAEAVLRRVTRAADAPLPLVEFHASFLLRHEKFKEAIGAIHAAVERASLAAVEEELLFCAGAIADFVGQLEADLEALLFEELRERHPGFSASGRMVVSAPVFRDNAVLRKCGAFEADPRLRKVCEYLNPTVAFTLEKEGTVGGPMAVDLRFGRRRGDFAAVQWGDE